MQTLLQNPFRDQDVKHPGGMSGIQARTEEDSPCRLSQGREDSTGHIPKVSDDHCSLKALLDQNTMDYQDGTTMYLDIPLIHTVSSYFLDLLDGGHVYAS